MHLRSQAEALRVYAIRVKCSREVLDQIAETKVRAERRLGELLVARPETRGGDRRSDEVEDQRSSDSTFDSYPPTLQNLGVSKFLSSRSQIIANIPEDLFEGRIRYTQKLNRGRDLSAEMFSYAKYLKREQEREQRRQDAALRAANISPDEKIQVLHGDFREVLTEFVPANTAAVVLTDPPYLRKDGTYLDLWISLSECAERILRPGKLLVCYSGKFCLDRCMEILGSHLQYVWTTVIVYPSLPDSIHALRIKTYFKLALLFSKGEYEPLMKRSWFKDVIDGDGYPGLKTSHPWQQGIKEAETLIESLTEEGDLVVDPFLGSGTVAVAAKKLNRRFIGCDVDEHYVNETLQRLEDVKTQ
ncbi:MAG: DNA-methyltransferase [Desulfomonilaceae bacterium]